MSANRIGKAGNRGALEKLPVMVSFIENSCMLWVQDMATESANAIVNLLDRLSEICTSAEKLKDAPQLNVIYATKFSEDNMWYRCVLKNTLPNDRVRVHYIDYGNYETISANQLVPLPDEIAAIPKFAYKLWLHNVRVVEAKRKEAINQLRELTESKLLHLSRFNQLPDGSGFYGLLYDADQSIIDVMLQKGLMEPRDFKKPQTSELFKTKLKAPESQREQRNEASNHQLTPHGQPASLKQPEKFSTPAPHEFVVRPSLLNQSNGAIDGSNKSENTMETVIADNMMLRSKLKSMQDEFNKLSSRTANTASIHDKIQLTCKLADKVRKCRIQFPTDESSDLIEEAIHLLSDEDAVNGQQPPPSLSAVSVKSDEYSHAQERILRTTDQDELNELIELRNVKRGELCDALDAFLSDTSIATLEDRDQKVKVASHNLDRQYHDFMLFIVQKQLPLSELLALYTDWKGKQMTNFKILRQETSVAETGICKALGQITANLSLTDDHNTGVPNLEFNFDQLLKSYYSCLDRELNTTDIQQSPDSLLLATVVHNVKAACNREHADITNILLLTTEYSRKLGELRRWLNDSPDMQPLSAVRKQILAMRSKLRHLLADLQDIEENEDCDQVEKEHVLQELEGVRRELHQHLVQEEVLLSEVAQLANDHFPELYHTHPQLKLDLSLKYGDVVKGGRELDYYTLAPVVGKAGVYTSHFNNEPIFIKEYTVSDQHAFLSNVKTYQQLSCDLITPLQAVFFSKSNRQAYTQTAVVGVPLCDFVTSHKLTPQDQEKIVRNIAACLQTLHTAGFTYSRLSPETIRCHGDMIFLDEINLSGQQPYSENWFLSKNLRFCPPEAVLGEPLNAHSDMYCLGLVVLWLHFPDVTFPLKTDGSPDLNLIHMDGPIRKLLDVLISRAQNWSLQETLARYYQYLGMCQKYMDTSNNKRGPSPGVLLPQQQQRGTSPSVEVAGVERDQIVGGEFRDASSPSSVNTSDETVSDGEVEPTRVVGRENFRSPYATESMKISRQLSEDTPTTTNHFVMSQGDEKIEHNDNYAGQVPPHILADWHNF